MPHILRFENRSFEFDDHIGVQLDIVEDEVGIEVLLSHLEMRAQASRLTSGHSTLHTPSPRLVASSTDNAPHFASAYLVFFNSPKLKF